MSSPWKQTCDRFLASDAPEKTKARLRESLAVVSEAHRRFAGHDVAMSFNGGKDCLVMLVIILAVCPRPPASIYIRTPNSFPEVDEFVANCVRTYGLDLVTSELPMKEALQEYLDEHKNTQAVFVGIRRGDPWASDLQHIQATDHGWPEFMRVHPVIDWEYDDVWTFLRATHTEYCHLYDLGYTSLGSVTTTVPNPALRTVDGFLPAYMLKDAKLERIGRTRKRAQEEKTEKVEEKAGGPADRESSGK